MHVAATACLTLVLSASIAFADAPEPKPLPPDDGERSSAPEGEPRAARPGEDEPPRRSPESFTPSERVGAEASVSFPADI